MLFNFIYNAFPLAIKFTKISNFIFEAITKNTSSVSRKKKSVYVFLELESN